MLSFGVLIVLTIGIGYLSISRLGASNDRFELLYNSEMAGAQQADDFTKVLTAFGRSARDGIIFVNSPKVVEADEKEMVDGFAALHKSLDEMDKTFYSKEGKEIVANIRRDLPAYEDAYHKLYAKLHAHNATGALAVLKAITPLRDAMGAYAASAVALKQQHGQVSYQTNAESFASARTLILTGAALNAALGLFLSWYIARGFAVPLGQAVVALEHLADGDLTASLAIHAHDEVGRMGDAFNKAIEKLNQTMQGVRESADITSSSSQQLASAAEAIASGAQEQAASLEETSASLEQITATVRQSADNAHQASQLATGSRTSAENGQEVVASAITAMTEINAASAKISDIISTIDEIAFQTNLLAVNAAVEAARAGEEGRGFAVVASEVRSLAQRSAGAAKEIKGLIQDSLKKVETGSALVNKSGETLQGIVGSVKRVTDIVGEIAASSAEQSTGVEQVNTAVTQMDQVTQSNSAQTEELSATAHTLSEEAGRLQELVAKFTLRGASFGGELSSRATRPQSGLVDLVRVKTASFAVSKHPSAARAATPKVIRHPATALAGTSINDDSFVEF